MMVPVKVKKLHDAAVKPQYANPGDSGMDVYTVQDIYIAPGETVIIPTGLAFAVPKGWEIQVRDRSGISSKTKLRVANSPGTVDSGYRAGVGVILDNISPQQYELCTEVCSGVTTMSIELAKRKVVRLTNGKLIQANEKFVVGTYYIPAGTRIAQIVFCSVGEAQLEEVDELDETERGQGGFGSTGTN